MIVELIKCFIYGLLAISIPILFFVMIAISPVFEEIVKIISLIIAITLIGYLIRS